MIRLLKSTLLGILVCGLVATLSFTGCKGKGPAPAKPAAAPKAPDAKPVAAPKAPDAKAVEKEKLAKAEAAFKTAGKTADAALGKKPKDFDTAIKAYTEAKAAVAGTSFDKKCDAELADLQKAKAQADAEAKANAGKAAEKEKLGKAEAAFKAAEAAWDKNPKDFDGALKLLADAKPLVAGTPFDKKCVDLAAEVTKAKDKAALAAKTTAEKDKLTKAEAAFKAAGKTAGAALDKKPKDFDTAIKAYTEAKPAVAGSAFEKKCTDELAVLEKAKAEAAKLPPVKVEPKPVVAAVKPVTDFLVKPAEDVKSAEEAWKKADETEKAVGKPERERLTAALPYHLFVLKAKDAEGKFDINAPAAALRIAQIVEKYAGNSAERLSAAKFYYVAASLNPGSDVWEKAEKGYLKAGKGRDIAGLLKSLSQNAAARATELYASGDDDDKAQAAKLQKFSASVGKRADALTAKYGGAKS